MTDIDESNLAEIEARAERARRGPHPNALTALSAVLDCVGADIPALCATLREAWARRDMWRHDHGILEGRMIEQNTRALSAEAARDALRSHADDLAAKSHAFRAERDDLRVERDALRARLNDADVIHSETLEEWAAGREHAVAERDALKARLQQAHDTAIGEAQQNNQVARDEVFQRVLAVEVTAALNAERAEVRRLQARVAELEAQQLDSCVETDLRD